ncbi:MAG: ABC transporter ATP-binding protein, partial [Acidimicrobiales bacterium]
METSTLIDIEDVSRIFVTRRGTTVAVQTLSLSVQAGGFLSLIGPSGCGKSTLLRIIGGLEQPTSGRVRFHPEATSSGETRGAPRIAFVFQEYGLFPWLSAIDNVAFGLRMSGVDRTQRRRRAAEWLERVGLSGFERSFPDQLSGGMRQRLSIARAFVTDPDVLLMDEPMGAVDAQTRLLLQEDLLRLWEETRKTVILVTHSIEEGLLLGDRLVVMSARPGRITSDFPITLPHPRTMDVTATPEFGALKAAV